MEIKIYNQDLICKLMIKYIKDHNLLPLNGGAIDRKKIISQVREKVKMCIENKIEYLPAARIVLIEGCNSWDNQDVVVPFKITRCGNDVYNVKMAVKKF
ncbi:MAG: hypothetical protein ACRDDY_10745 [Clostridium sp.]|uniref:hypothetical protein n=1 Tax=Clostridium sp. TaxID=1506 RepID=UPI003EE4664E